MAQQSNVIPFQPAPSASAHLACGKCGTIAEVKCDCGVDYIYVRASERAEKAIMEHPEKSDRIIAAEVGVGIMTVSRARKKATVPNGTVRVGKDGKKRRLPRPTGRTSTALPNGYNTLSEAVSAGIEIERSGGSRAEAEAKSGLSHAGYYMGRDIVMLSERTDLSAKDAEIVKHALQQLNESRLVTIAYSKVRPIVCRVWGKKGLRLKSDKKRAEAFSSALSYLLTVCTSAAKIIIPYLSKEQCASALDSIKEAKQALDVLQRRIRKGDGEYHE